jgi:outer membrane protein assembly factor BamB
MRKGVGVKAKSALWLLICVAAIGHAADTHVVGWRTDWTGKYPGADPPTRWSLTENVVWKTPMPGWSNATPVIVGERLFVCSERTVLLCVDLRTGAVLWQRTNDYLGALPPEEAAEARRLLDQVDMVGLNKQRRSARSRLTRVQNELKKTPENGALLEEKADLERRIEQLNVELKPVESLIMPDPHGVNGYSSPTPVSDGEYVYALFGNGVVACYSLDGERRWARPVDKPRIGYGQSASPLLIGDRLIVHINELFALDPASGATLWRSEAESCWGTSVAAQVGGDDAVITPNGEVFRVADGRRIARHKCKLRFSQPIVHDGIVYYIQRGGRAYRLPGAAAEESEELWRTEPDKSRRYASPVLHEGIIYTVGELGVFAAIDAATGEVVYERKLDLAEKAQTFPSIALAGSYVFVSSSDGTTFVFAAGREFEQVGRNTLEPFRSSPVFRGGRIYIRGLKNLYCIGR